MTTVMVKPMIDPKGPLKGKGLSLAQWDRDAQDQLMQIRGEMAALASATRALEGRRITLAVNKLRDAEQLRWRFRYRSDGGTSRHATWDAIKLLLPSFSPVLIGWYEEVNGMAVVLNHKEQVARYQCKTIERLLAGRHTTEMRLRSTVGRGVGGGRPRASSMS